MGPSAVNEGLHIVRIKPWYCGRWSLSSWEDPQPPPPTQSYTGSEYTEIDHSFNSDITFVCLNWSEFLLFYSIEGDKENGYVDFLRNRLHRSQKILWILDHGRTRMRPRRIQYTFACCSAASYKVPNRIDTGCSSCTDVGSGPTSLRACRCTTNQESAMQGIHFQTVSCLGLFPSARC